MDEKDRKQTVASFLKDMQTTISRMRELMVAMPPRALQGYSYAQPTSKSMADQRGADEDQHQVEGPDNLINKNQFLLEYVHALLFAQLPDAKVFQKIYYKDPNTKQWSENDRLVLLEDVLILVEAKAGAAATIASPELDFERHAQTIHELALKAQSQCDRFFRYIALDDEVPLYQRPDDKYKECARVRRSVYRVIVPVGLTVASFSPLAAFRKKLPHVVPMLGKHAFMSLAIDDLFVLKRFLPTPGLFAHYLKVWHSVAGIRKAHLFDEFDHLGAYLTKNRFDHDMAGQLKDSKTSMALLSGMSEIVDKYFEEEDWETKTTPMQDIPVEVSKPLDALDANRASGWLSDESHIRDFGGDGKNNLAQMLVKHGKNLNEHSFRNFSLRGDGDPLFVWLQRQNYQVDWTQTSSKASAAAVVLKAESASGIFAEVSADAVDHQAKSFAVQIPTSCATENAHIY